MRTIPAALVCILMMAACRSASPVKAGDVGNYTGLRLCAGAVVRDLTTDEERETTPGFSFHGALRLPDSCRNDFEAQIAELAGPECPAWRNGQRACMVLDASDRSRTKKHTTVAVKALGSGRYALRFYE